MWGTGTTLTMASKSAGKRGAIIRASRPPSHRRRIGFRRRNGRKKAVTTRATPRRASSCTTIGHVDQRLVVHRVERPLLGERLVLVAGILPPVAKPRATGTGCRAWRRATGLRPEISVPFEPAAPY